MRNLLSPWSTADSPSSGQDQTIGSANGKKESEMRHWWLVEHSNVLLRTNDFSQSPLNRINITTVKSCAYHSLHTLFFRDNSSFGSFETLPVSLFDRWTWQTPISWLADNTATLRISLITFHCNEARIQRFRRTWVSFSDTCFYYIGILKLSQRDNNGSLTSFPLSIEHPIIKQKPNTTARKKKKRWNTFEIFQAAMNRWETK